MILQEQLAAIDRFETERLIMRKMRESDDYDFFAYANDLDTIKFVMPQQETIEEARDFMGKHFLEKLLGKYVIELKSESKMIGTIDFQNLDAFSKTAEVGYTIRHDYWNQGLATEALQGLLDIAFTKLNLVRVMAYIDADNPASGRVLEKSGFRKCGLGRKVYYRKFDDTHPDCIFYDMIDDDYFGK